MQHHDGDAAASARAGLPPADIDAGDGATLVNRRELARLFRVSEPTVVSWVDQGCPVEKQGGNGVAYEFDPRRVIEWRKAREATEAEQARARQQELAQLEMELLGGDTAQGESLRNLSPEQRNKALQAELTAIRLAQARGELVRADEVLADFEAVFSLLRQRLLSLPAVLTRLVGLTGEQTRAIDSEIKLTLRALHDQVASPTLREADRDRDAA